MKEIESNAVSEPMPTSSLVNEIESRLQNFDLQDVPVREKPVEDTLSCDNENEMSEQDEFSMQSIADDNSFRSPKPIVRRRNLSWNKDVRGNRSKGAAGSKSGISSLHSSPAVRRRYSIHVY